MTLPMLKLMKTCHNTRDTEEKKEVKVEWRNMSPKIQNGIAEGLKRLAETSQEEIRNVCTELLASY